MLPSVLLDLNLTISAPRIMQPSMDFTELRRHSYPRLFANVWEYLDFRRHLSEISSTSPDRLMTATLKQHGGWFSYTLSAGDDARISTTCDVFRATAVRLRAFHTGSARVALFLKRFLRTGDRKWLEVDRPFGPLHGGRVTANREYIWRGTKDDIDTDTWLDLVEDESLARLLDRADRLTAKSSGEVDDLIQLFRSWELLKTIPEHHEYHVEVLRRRIQYVIVDKEFEDLPRAVRWARALVEAEPYDVLNWWNLFWTVERLEGKAASVEIVQEALRRHGPDFTLYYELADLLCALDRLDEAQETMLQALKDYTVCNAMAATSCAASRLCNKPFLMQG